MAPLRPLAPAINPHDFEVAGVQYRVAEYRKDMGGPHLKVTRLGKNPITVMTRGLDYGARPFWIGGYAITQPELRDAIASAVTALADGPAATGSS